MKMITFPQAEIIYIDTMKWCKPVEFGGLRTSTPTENLYACKAKKIFPSGLYRY